MPFLLPLALLCLINLQAMAAPSPEEDDGDLFNLPLEELLTISVVSAANTPQRLAEAPATIRVITARQIARRGYLTLSDALADLPGIDLINVHGAYPVIYTPRGAYGDENRRLLLMIDGIEDTSLNGSFEIAGQAYTLHSVERIEVLWGPASALYGANAFSGIINVITKQGKAHQGASYTRGLGSDDTRLDKFYLNHQLERTNVALSGYRVATDGPKFRNRHPEFSDAYVDDAYQLLLRINHQRPDLHWRLGGHIHSNPMGDGTFGNSPTAFFNLPPASPGNPGSSGFLNFDLAGEPPSHWHSYFHTAFAEFDYRLTQDTRIEGQYHFRETGLDKDSYSYSLNNGVFFRFRGSSYSNRHGLKLMLEHQDRRDGQWHLGMEYHNNNIERGIRPLVIDPAITVIEGLPITNWRGGFGERRQLDTHNRGLMTQYITPLSFLDDTQLTLGARYDDNSLYGSFFSPRTGLVHELNERLSLKLLYGRAFRAPTPFELFSSSPIRLPNPQLKPEKVNTLELGLHYQREKVQFQATAYYNKLEDIIVEGIPIGNNLFQVQNAGEARIRGAETTLDMTVSPALAVSANYSYQRGRQDNGQGEFNVPNIARHKANLSMDWAWDNGYSLHWHHHWQSDIDTIATNPLRQIDSALVGRLALQSPAFFDNRLRVHLRIDNLYNHRYESPGHRSADGDRFSPVNEQRGRHWLLQLTYQHRFDTTSKP